MLSKTKFSTKLHEKTHTRKEIEYVLVSCSVKNIYIIIIIKMPFTVFRL